MCCAGTCSESAYRIQRKNLIAKRRTPNRPTSECPVSPFVTWVDTELDDLWASGLEDTRKVMLQRLGMELLASVIFRLEDVKIHHLWYAADAHIF